MKKNLLRLIAKLGVHDYTNKKTAKMGLIKRCLQRWQPTNLTEELRARIATTTKWSSFDHRDQQTILTIMLHGRQGDCMLYMRAAIEYYIKRHRFVFPDETHQGLRNTETTFEALHLLFAATVEHMEQLHHCFQRSLRVRRRRLSDSGVYRIGPFNKYVQDQWKLRPVELRQICLTTKSTNVMKLLSSEWRNTPAIQAQYKYK
jgi:hypothetical protein